MNDTSMLVNIGFTEDQFETNKPLKEITHFKTGGTADLFVSPKTPEQLQKLLTELHDNNPELPIFIWGDASNLLVSDKGIRGVVINMQSLQYEPDYQPEANGYYRFSSGMLSSDLALKTAEKGLKNMETFHGLPGTLGGACYMNARCYDAEIADFFAGAHCLDYSGAFHYIEKKEDEWAYKLSPFQNNNLIILSVDLKLEQTDKASELIATALKFKEDRTQKGHYNFPCAGSTFKNNRSFGKPTGQIIDSLGLKGYRIGGAQISPYHANILINEKNASSTDVLNLINYVKEQVKKAYGFELESEVMPVGQWD